MERYLDIDPLKHKEFLYHFYVKSIKNNFGVREEFASQWNISS